MKKGYRAPRMEWIDFDHAERIAASNQECQIWWCNAGVNGYCENLTKRMTNIIA